MKCLVYISICLFGITVNAQDLHSSNIQYLSQLYNSALTGLNNELDASVSYRTQWRKLGTPFNAYSATVGSVLQPYKRNKKGKFALGASLFREQTAVNSSVTSFTVAPTYHLKLTKYSSLSLGFNVGYFGLTFNEQNGSWESQHNGLFYDETILSGEVFETSTNHSFDIGSGLIYTLKNRRDMKIVQVGGSLFHLNKPTISFTSIEEDKLPIRKVAFASVAIPFGTSYSYVELKGLYQNQQHFKSLTYGAMLKVKLMEKALFTSSNSKQNSLYLGFGAYLRNNDAFILNLSLQKTNWKLGIAYDITTSKLKQANNKQGATEIQFWYSIPSFKNKAKS